MDLLLQMLKSAAQPKPAASSHGERGQPSSSTAPQPSRSSRKTDKDDMTDMIRQLEEAMEVAKQKCSSSSKPPPRAAEPPTRPKRDMTISDVQNFLSQFNLQMPQPKVQEPPPPSEPKVSNDLLKLLKAVAAKSKPVVQEERPPNLGKVLLEVLKKHPEMLTQKGKERAPPHSVMLPSSSHSRSTEPEENSSYGKKGGDEFINAWLSNAHKLVTSGMVSETSESKKKFVGEVQGAEKRAHSKPDVPVSKKKARRSPSSSSSSSSSSSDDDRVSRKEQAKLKVAASQKHSESQSKSLHRTQKERPKHSRSRSRGSSRDSRHSRSQKRSKYSEHSPKGSRRGHHSSNSDRSSRSRSHHRRSRSRSHHRRSHSRSRSRDSHRRSRSRSYRDYDSRSRYRSYQQRSRSRSRSRSYSPLRKDYRNAQRGSYRGRWRPYEWRPYERRPFRARGTFPRGRYQRPFYKHDSGDHRRDTRTHSHSKSGSDRSRSRSRSPSKKREERNPSAHEDDAAEDHESQKSRLMKHAIEGTDKNYAYRERGSFRGRWQPRRARYSTQGMILPRCAMDSVQRPRSFEDVKKKMHSREKKEDLYVKKKSKRSDKDVPDSSSSPPRRTKKFHPHPLPDTEAVSDNSQSHSPKTVLGSKSTHDAEDKEPKKEEQKEEKTVDNKKDVPTSEEENKVVEQPVAGPFVPSKWDHIPDSSTSPPPDREATEETAISNDKEQSENSRKKVSASKTEAEASQGNLKEATKKGRDVKPKQRVKRNPYLESMSLLDLLLRMLHLARSLPSCSEKHKNVTIKRMNALFPYMPEKVTSENNPNIEKHWATFVPAFEMLNETWQNKQHHVINVLETKEYRDKGWALRNQWLESIKDVVSVLWRLNACFHPEILDTENIRRQPEETFLALPEEEEKLITVSGSDVSDEDLEKVVVTEEDGGLIIISEEPEDAERTESEPDSEPEPEIAPKPRVEIKRGIRRGFSRRSRSFKK